VPDEVRPNGDLQQRQEIKKCLHAF
jgi:hypothetical protein